MALFVSSLTACGGGGGAGGGGESPGALVGSFLQKPEGGGYFVDEHASGRASRLRLIEIFWGRLVNVHGIDAGGETLDQPLLRDFVINENLRSEPGRYALETNPITQDTRLVIQRQPGLADTGTGSFESLLRSTANFLPGLLPKAPDTISSTPFSVVARNATLMLHFDDLLDDDGDSVLELSQWLRLITGYPPRLPLQARIVFDPNHGGVFGGEFHSTRVLIDLTVSETEATDSPVPLQLNSLGLPRSNFLSEAANVSLVLPTLPDPGSGLFTVLHNLAGRGIDPEASAPFDSASPTRPLVRALRAGNQEDANNGFLLDLEAPHVIGTWPSVVLEARQVDASGFDWTLDLRFTSSCAKTPEPGDIVVAGEHFMEVKLIGSAPDASGFVRIRVRPLGLSPPEAGELIGIASYEGRYRSGIAVDRACWLSFTPRPKLYPGNDVSSQAVTSIRFSEPMDPDTALPFDSMMTVRGAEDTALSSTNLIVGEIRLSADLRTFRFAPSVPYSHEGERPFYHLRIPAIGGLRDLAGNELATPLPRVPYTIDPESLRTDHSSFVMRFDSPDELDPIGAPDLQGQFTYQFTRGTIRPREAITASRIVDRTNPILSVMPAFAPGVATPLSPLGSKLQTVWRYADLGWSIRDQTKYNLDVVGLSWSPARGQVSADFFEQFEIRLAHSNKLPDEQRRAPITGGMKYPISGLWEGPVPFRENILIDPQSPQKIMNDVSRGYRIDSRDLSFSVTGTPLMPWPINRDGGPLLSFTWRDTAAIATGGNFGVGVPLDSEVGQPINLEDAFGTFAGPGHVPTVGLPLLVEIRCFPSESAIGLNPLAIYLASNVSAAPNFRAYSTGGFNNQGQRITKNPNLEESPSGGFNPGSRPPGNPTRRTADNSLYLGQMDYVIRVSRVHTIWVDTHSDSTRFEQVVLEPRAEAQPPGTQIVVDFRGATSFDGAGTRPFSASSIDPYGEPRVGSIQFHNGDPLWKNDIREIDGARYLQLRFSFSSNVAAGLVAELSAVGVAYILE